MTRQAGSSVRPWDLIRVVVSPAFPGGALERIVFLAFARHADENGVCWPSLSTVARETGLSVNCVAKSVHRLRDVGLLSWVARPGDVSLYHVDQSALANLLVRRNELSAVTEEAPSVGHEPPHSVGGLPIGSDVHPPTPGGTPPHNMGRPPHVVGDTPTPGGDEVALEAAQQVLNEAAHEDGAVAAPAPAPPALTGLTFDDTGAPLVVRAGPEPPPTLPGVLLWVRLRPPGMYVGLDEGRLAELRASYPSVDVLREFARPEGVRDWNGCCLPHKRKRPGAKGFWRHVHLWLEGEQKRAEQAHRRGFALSARTLTQVVPGTLCGCGAPKAEGAALCQGCAEQYAAFVRDDVSRERRPKEVLP